MKEGIKRSAINIALGKIPYLKLTRMAGSALFKISAHSAISPYRVGVISRKINSVPGNSIYDKKLQSSQKDWPFLIWGGVPSDERTSAKSRTNQK